MYRHNEKQIQFENFKLPFSGKLRSDNRWVKLTKQIPWQEIEKLYSSSLSLSGKGAPALSVRVMGDGHKYISNSVMIRQSGSCGVTIQKEPGNIPLPISAQGCFG